MNIYLAKSNNSNPEFLIKIRDFLKKFKTVEIKEYQGGTYGDKDLIDSDLLIVIPDLSTKSGDTFILGKGLLNQILKFEETHSMENVVFVSGFAKETNEIEAYFFSDFEDNTFEECYDLINGGKDYVNTARVMFDVDSDYLGCCVYNDNLFDYLGEIITCNLEDGDLYSDEDVENIFSEIAISITTTEKKYKYLLIK